MAQTQFKQRTLSLDNVRKNSVVVADLNKRDEDSVFNQEYKKASKAIRRIIAENKNKAAEDRSCCAACRNRNCSSCKNRDRRRYNLTEFQTAVPFIGDRGSGKTSIMCSVLEYLRSYHGDTEDAAFRLGSENQSVRFITFDMIDANTLKCTEDIMEIILSRMLSYLEELPADCDFRDLYRQIDALHEDLGQVYWKQQEQREFGLTGLQRIADSQKSITSFQKLVEQFTKDVSRYHFDCHPCYLVIALDDIDMYQGGKNGMTDNQFALLDHIYNHMRVPGLIVLMTYNEHILRRKCNAHFSKLYFGGWKPDYINSSNQEDIDALTAQFMSKLFPQERRIYLPNYMFVDAGNHSNLYVRPKLTKAESGRPELLPPFTEDRELPVKAFMLRLIAHKTGVYFDAAGTKQHFFEPRNLRELGELFEMIHSMEDIPEIMSADVKEQIRARNRQELLNYLYNQFALKHLSTEEYREFSRLSALPLHRQGRTLVDRIRDHRKNYVTSKEDTGYLDPTKHDRWRYSYGELLHNLYYSTRIPKDNLSYDGFYSKEFIHCVLGTHSVLLNQIIHLEGAPELLTQTIGSSVAGRWANEMLPKLKAETLEPRPAGSLSIPIRHFFGWDIPHDVLAALTHPHYDEAGSPDIIRRFLEAFILVGMFFTGFPTKGLQIVPRAGLLKGEYPVLSLDSASEDHICFNVMNFVLNLYHYQDYLDKMFAKLEKLGDDLAELFTRDWDGLRANAEWLIQKEQKGIQSNDSDDPANSQMSFFYQQKSTTRVENYLDAIKLADEWEKLLSGTIFVDDPDPKTKFMKEWMAIIDDLKRNGFVKPIRRWNQEFKSLTATVLPVQHFDMMYNITKRLANVSYHDIPEEAAVEDICDCFADLYRNVAEELDLQDRLYELPGRKGFADAFRSSMFYQKFTVDSEERNPYIAPILVSMISSALVQKDRRDAVSDLMLPPLPDFSFDL